MVMTLALYGFIGITEYNWFAVKIQQFCFLHMAILEAHNKI